MPQRHHGHFCKAHRRFVRRCPKPTSSSTVARLKLWKHVNHKAKKIARKDIESNGPWGHRFTRWFCFVKIKRPLAKLSKTWSEPYKIHENVRETASTKAICMSNAISLHFFLHAHLLTRLLSQKLCNAWRESWKKKRRMEERERKKYFISLIIGNCF